MAVRERSNGHGGWLMGWGGAGRWCGPWGGDVGGG
jgi:hypothetical protein